jgi:hypothetical protein
MSKVLKKRKINKSITIDNNIINNDNINYNKILFNAVKDKKIKIKKNTEENKVSFLHAIDKLIDTSCSLLSFSKLIKVKGCFKSIFG